MNQALQIPLFRRILSLHSNLRPLKDFHFGDTSLPLKKETYQFSTNRLVRKDRFSLKKKIQYYRI